MYNAGSSYASSSSSTAKQGGKGRGNGNGGARAPKSSHPHSKREKKRKALSATRTRRIAEDQKVDALEEAVRGYEYDATSHPHTPDGEKKAFSDLPLSENTKRGLKKAYFTHMTPIQTLSLPLTLKGTDVLGAARTGSGKTLAFLIPVLETLYRKKWGASDGLGALVVSPTRELAVQIFDVLRTIGGFHSFSAGLVIGGKSLKDEGERLGRMNILVATPGRLLQHMDQTYGFDAAGLQILVLDEADRILDMGFSKTLSALLGHLPRERQTLLFSATQTKSVEDLARLSMKEAVYVDAEPAQGVDAAASGEVNANGESNANANAEKTTTATTPEQLTQHYLVTPLPTKLSMLWSFIRTHLHTKMLVFLSSCKQVRFVYESFAKMRPGIPLIHMHGKQKQSLRLSNYERFGKSKEGVMFATDVAARGLDFAGLGWVVQVDAPEDAETYVHRVGRTARYEEKGRALMFLDPSEEEGMVRELGRKGVRVERMKVRGSKVVSVERQLQALMWSEPEMKYLAQRAFVSYLRSIHLHKNKDVFKLGELAVDAYAESLGLPGTPKIKFLTKEMARARKNRDFRAERVLEEAEVEAEDEAESDAGAEAESDVDAAVDAANAEVDDVEVDIGAAKKKQGKTKYEKMFGRKNQDVLTPHYERIIDRSDSSDSHSDGDSDAGSGGGDGFMQLKRVDHALDDDDEGAGGEMYDVRVENLSNRKAKLGRAKRAVVLHAPIGGFSSAPSASAASASLGNGVAGARRQGKIVFGDDGEARAANPVATDAAAWVRERGGEEGVRREAEVYASAERERVGKADVRDREEAREKRRERKRKRKEREGQMQGDDEGDYDGGDYDEEGRGGGGRESVGIMPMEEDDGYVSPDFGFADEDEDEEVEEVERPMRKKARRTVEDDEEVAMRLLRGR